MSGRLPWALLAACATSAGAADLILPAHSHLSLGREQWANFNRSEALTHFSAAMASAPNDAEVLSEYAAATPDRALEIALLNRLRFSGTPAQTRQDAERRLRVLSCLGSRVVHQLASPYTAHEFRLPVAHTRESHAAGWVLPVRLNDGRPLRLLLDTGARGILISSRTARSLHLESLGPTVLGGFGEGGNVAGEYRLAASLQVGDLRYRHVIIEVGAVELPAELDGVAGLELFRHFGITVDGPRQLLRLTPFDAESAEGDGERPWSNVKGHGGQTMRRAGHLLIVPGRINSRSGARFVLDSGAAVSMLQVREPAIAMRRVALQGLSGFSSVDEMMQPVQIQVGGREMVLRHALAADLAPIGDRFGIQIDGLLGFPLLRGVATSIDLRGGRFAMHSAQ